MSYTIINIPIEFRKSFIRDLVNENIKKGETGYICTINANIIAEASQNLSFLNILRNSLINICDGSVLSKGVGWIYKKKLEAWPGPDFFMDFVKHKELKHFFLGTNDYTLKFLKANLLKLNPKIDNSIFLPLPYNDVNEFDYEAIAKNINNHKPDLIWVSLGAPKQEIFASKISPLLNRGIVVCVGAAFDFYGNPNGHKRAPVFLRTLNLEWLWRLILNPKKTFKRLRKEFYTVPLILFKEKLNNRQHFL